MTDDLINRARLALEGYHKDHRAFGAEIARDSLGLCACDLLPEAIEEIKRLEAKLAVAVEALEVVAEDPYQFDQRVRVFKRMARAILAEIKG